MLARDYKQEDLTGWIEQPKLNGVRATWTGSTLLFRSRREVKSCDHIIKQIYMLGLQETPLDMEFYNHELDFETINGLAARKKSSDETAQLQAHIFDIAEEDEEQEERLIYLDKIIPANSIIKKVPWSIVASNEDAERKLKSHIKNGYEGIIYRNPEGFYERGKSYDLLRKKPVYDIEARLIGFNESTADLHKDTFGSLLLELPNGKTFNCSGMTEEQRKGFTIGQLITVEYGTMSKYGVPVFPRFKGVRHDI